MSRMTITRSRALASLGLLALAAMVAGMARLATVRMGRQPDGSFLVSSGQRIEGGSIAFRGRPIDLALHPRERGLRRPEQVRGLPGDHGGAPGGAQGRTLHHAGRDHGRVPRSRLVARRHAALRQHQPGLRPGLHLQGRRAEGGRADRASSPRGPRATRSPAGWRSPATARGCSSPRPTATPSPRSTWRRSSSCASTRSRPCRTSRGSRRTSGRWSSATGAAGSPGPGDRTAKSQDLDIVVDDRGAPASGTVSLVDRATGATRHVEVGIHPDGDRRARAAAPTSPTR